MRFKMHTEEFGEYDNMILPREDIEQSLNKWGSSYCKFWSSQFIGVINVKDEFHNKGYGSKIWEKIEKLFSDTLLWETHTYFDKRNIHFYVNRLKFKIVEIQSQTQGWG